MTYIQTNRRSEDFDMAHPHYMLFNDPYKISAEHNDRLKHNTEYGSELNGYFRQWWSENDMFGYDFTDTGFVEHMKTVYSNLKKAGIKDSLHWQMRKERWCFMNLPTGLSEHSRRWETFSALTVKHVCRENYPKYMKRTSGEQFQIYLTILSPTLRKEK